MIILNFKFLVIYITLFPQIIGSTLLSLATTITINEKIDESCITIEQYALNCSSYILNRVKSTNAANNLKNTSLSTEIADVDIGIKSLLVNEKMVITANENMITIVNENIVTAADENMIQPIEQKVNTMAMEIDNYQKKFTFNKLEDAIPKSNNSNKTIDEYHFMSFQEWKKQKEIEMINNQIQKLDNVSVLKNDSKTAISIINKEADVSDENISTKLIDEEDQGKTYKDKINYASVDCAATIVKTNKDARGASAILMENKDNYLINVCSSTNKFVIIELCQDILVDSVVIGNFEFFSSLFKDLKISVSDRFPANNWNVLGEFQAENIRDIQSFKINNPKIWARYLKLEILSHYGNEFYCPISLVRVHGKTMMEKYKEEEDLLLSSSIEKEELEINSDITNITYKNSLDNSNKECKNISPYLGLNDFLRDMNSSTYEFCEANFTVSNTTQNIETKTTQESIYKNIMKRLALLESNAGLSLLYIEEQSKLLSSAFSHLEEQQTYTFESLVKSFNSTMTNQLIMFKESYSLLKNDYNKLFKAKESKQKKLLIESKINIALLGNELKFQKRVSIFNSIMIICLLAYVILTRQAYIDSDIDNIDDSNVDMKYENKLLEKSSNFSSKFKKNQISKRKTKYLKENTPLI